MEGLERLIELKKSFQEMLEEMRRATNYCEQGVKEVGEKIAFTEKMQALEDKKLKPPFSKDDDLYMSVTISNAHVFGLSSDSTEKMKKIMDVLEVTARLKNAINAENLGDNGFKLGESNVFPIWDHKLKTFTMVDLRNAETQSLPSWVYLRSQAALEKLLACPKYVQDWKIYNGIALD